MAPRGQRDRQASRREQYGSLEARSVWLADILRRRVWSYIPGSRLPGERELARRFRISLRVARRAMEILADEGLVSSTRGKGSIVVREQAHAMPINRVFAVISDEKQPTAAETQAVLLGALEDCGRRGRPFDVLRSDRLDLNQPDCLMSVIRGAGLPLEVGWMFVRTRPPAHVLETWQIWRTPLVLVNDDPILPANTVNPDAQGAMYRAVERAWLLGHRRIAYVAAAGGPPGGQPGGGQPVVGQPGPARWPGDDPDPVARARWLGFLLALQRYQPDQPIDERLVWWLGPPTGLAAQPGSSPRDQAEAQRTLNDRLAGLADLGSARPTAIVTADLRIACDVLTACQRLHIDVPGQLSVISSGLERRELPRDLVNRVSRSSEGRPERIGQLATSLLAEAHLSYAPVKLLAESEWIDGQSLGPAGK